MTTIRTSCLICGDIELTIDQVTLEPKQYRFDCPECGMRQHRPADRQTKKMLLTAGVRYEGMGPITEEEIEIFVMELETLILDQNSG